MEFNSVGYLVLLTATVCLFFSSDYRRRLSVLIGASLLFYAVWSIPFTSLILVSAFVDFFAARRISRARSQREKRLVLALSLAVNLGLLGYFKYANFFLENVQALFGSQVSYLEIILPPGISFYTFQTMSYTIDVYRGRLQPTSSFRRFLLYVSFFPQLIAGPIERAGHLLVQFDHAGTRRFRVENLVSGVQMIVWGLFKKVVIADNVARVADAVYGSPGDYGGWAMLAASYAFTLQIYCDFSAYSEIARGSARIFGIDLMRNFDQPYLTRNIQDFWRRWHISLSNWFRDYVYIPLGGSRGGRRRALRNLVLTMLASGLWHGAAWNFVLWGLLHGALLLAHALSSKRRRERSATQRFGKLVAFSCWFGTFHAVVLGWILFRSPDLAVFWEFVSTIGSAIFGGVLPDAGALAFMAMTFAFVACSHLERKYRVLEEIWGNSTMAAGFTIALLVGLSMWGVKDGARFIYFQF